MFCFSFNGKKLAVFAMLLAFSMAMAPFESDARMPGIPKIGGSAAQSSSDASPEQTQAQQEKLVRQYMASAAKISEAQQLMALAFGLKEEADKLEAEKVNLLSGNVMSKDAIKKQQAVSEEAQKKIDEKMSAQEELSDEGKSYYQKSLIPFTQGVFLGKEMVPQAKELATNIEATIKKGSVMEKVKLTKALDVGLFLAPKIPGYVSDLVGGASKYFTFAKKNEIAIPKDAEAELGDL